jgi:uncharacterized SAM-binding protein YcdF (DUF218 family)
MLATMTPEHVSDINTLSHFLSHPQITSLSSCDPVDCIVICASAVLHSATVLFTTLEARPELTKTLVLCGGIGHSTSLIYEAVARHERYQSIKDEVRGLPEARVLEMIMEEFFHVEKIKSKGCRILVEDKSTNCGANALESRKLLEKERVSTPRSCIVIQDPTMALRTVASFEKTFADVSNPPKFVSCPVFVPKVRNTGSDLEYDVGYDVEDVSGEELWEINRFLDLIIGEIPRLRDDGKGYGPNGKGFITHVDVSPEVERSWKRLQDVVGRSR